MCFVVSFFFYFRNVMTIEPNLVFFYKRRDNATLFLIQCIERLYKNIEADNVGTWLIPFLNGVSPQMVSKFKNTTQVISTSNLLVASSKVFLNFSFVSFCFVVWLLSVLFEHWIRSCYSLIKSIKKIRIILVRAINWTKPKLILGFLYYEIGGTFKTLTVGAKRILR